ncbi:MAG: hypothetical protein ACI4EA_11730 [Candidatus Ornithomonoglobus sp.]
MRTFKKKVACLALTVITSISMLNLVSVAAEDDEEIIFPEDSIVEVDDTLSAGEEIEINSLPVTVGDMAEEGETEEGESVKTTGGDEILSIGDDEEVFTDDSDSPTLEGNDEVAENENMELNAAYITASATSISIKKGSTSSVTFGYTNYSGSVYFQYGLSNSSLMSASWGSWSGNKVPLKITGKALGSGYINIYLKNARTGATLASMKLYVNVSSPTTPKLTLSSSSASVAVGKSVKVNASYSGYSGNVYMQYSSTNNSSYSCSWGGWSGNTVPLTITGKAQGSGRVTITLRAASSGVILATAYLSVSVYRATTPKLTASASSASIKAGNSASIRFTVSGVSGTYALQAVSSNTNAYSVYWGNWSGSSINMTITGKNAGSGSIVVYLVVNGSKITSVTINPVKVTASNPTLTASKTSVAVSKGGSTRINLTYSNCSDTVYMQYGLSNSYIGCTWGSWSGTTCPLTITGKTNGQTKLIVYLKKASTGTVLASTTITVTTSGGDSSGGQSIAVGNISYSFSNYSKNYIPLSTCKYMYGDNQMAKNIYSQNIGNGGVCFGMATSAELFYVSGAPSVTNYKSSASRAYNLSKTDYSSTYRLSVSDFVEAMHITQVSSYMTRSKGLDSLVSTVKSEIANGRPVEVLVFGKEGGHAVTAIGYNQVSTTECDLYIYDSNYPNTTRTLPIKKSTSGGSYSSWSYSISSAIVWGTGKQYADISYITYSTMKNVWDKRGTLGSGIYNLCSVNADTFKLTNFEGEVVAEYENGELKSKADDVIDLPINNLILDENGDIIEQEDYPMLLYIPQDMYTIDGFDETQGEVEISLACDGLSLEVNADTDSLSIVASDKENIADVSLTPEEGTDYTISLGSSMDGNPDVVQLKGTASGTELSLSMDSEGNLSLSGDAESAALSLTDSEDSTYDIEASATEGGTISDSGVTTLAAGGNKYYSFTADDGYEIKDVLVDGISIGIKNEYSFEDVNTNHSIRVVFAKNISVCSVELSETSFNFDGTDKCPEVIVKNENGDELIKNEDYEISYMDNLDAGTAYVVISATAEGDYTGVVMIPFTITSIGKIESGSYNAKDNAVNVNVTNDGSGIVIVAVYDQNGQLMAVKYQNAKDADNNPMTFSFADESFNITDNNKIKAIMVNNFEKLMPLCSHIEIDTTE